MCLKVINKLDRRKHLLVIQTGYIVNAPNYKIIMLFIPQGERCKNPLKNSAEIAFYCLSAPQKMK